MQHLEGSGTPVLYIGRRFLEVNPLNAKLNPICHFLALLGAHHILHISCVRVKVHLSVIGRIIDLLVRFPILEF
jgi:hypothetical protein